MNSINDKGGTGMNRGTIIRTILGIAVSINTALAVTDVTTFGNEKLNMAYKIASLVVNFIVVAINTYYNNDYTEEGVIGTAITRHLKAVNRGEEAVEEEEVTEE